MFAFLLKVFRAPCDAHVRRETVCCPHLKAVNRQPLLEFHFDEIMPFITHSSSCDSIHDRIP